jgi:small conductance mechanosensitive channel
MRTALSDLFSETLATVTGWAHDLFALLPNLLVAAVVVGIAWASAGFAQRLAARFAGRVSENRQLNRLAGVGARLLVLGAGLMITLEVLHLEKTVASLLAGLGVAGIALGFAFQDIAANSMSGLMMAISRPFRIGDLIETAGQLGTVCHIDLRNTTMLRVDGIHVILPNKEIFSKPILNYTREAPRRVTVAVGVAYDSELSLVERVAREAVQDVPNRLTDRDIDVLFTSFGGSSIDLEVRYWTDNSVQGGWLKSRSDAIQRIKAAFEAHSIDIPFPIRTLQVSGDSRPISVKRLEHRVEAAEA